MIVVEMRRFTTLKGRTLQSEFRGSAVAAYVDIIFGCNFSCTYCAVPSARGVEVSRPPQQVLDVMVTLELAQQSTAIKSVLPWRRVAV